MESLKSILDRIVEQNPQLKRAKQQKESEKLPLLAYLEKLQQEETQLTKSK